MSRTLRAAYAETLRVLTDAGLPGPERDARDLVAWALGIAPTSVSLEGGRAVDESAAGRLQAAVAQRVQGRPVAQIIGVRAFWGMDFKVTGDVLDPRPETETIVATALEGPPVARILDLGTGSGILAISLLVEWEAATAVAVDLSPAALKIAGENAQTHGVDGRMTLIEGSWFDKVDGQFDLIVSNPPYIAASEFVDLDPGVRNWEPEMALSPGADGLAAYRVISAQASAYLKPGGWLIVECGYQQAQGVKTLFETAGARRIEVLRDMNGHERCIKCQYVA
ncbi:MAG: peptide chain release factor N(5)-glutamine methyltransferase [Pseudomonadota bacterium]